MRKILPVLALCFLSSSVFAGSSCPYHWCMWFFGATEVARNVAPEYNRPIRFVQLLGIGVIIGSTARYVISKCYSEPKQDEAKSHS